MNKIDFPFYEIIKNDANGYECGRERCDDFYTTYRRLSALTEIFPEYTFKVILITEIGIFKLIQWTGKK